MITAEALEAAFDVAVKARVRGMNARSAAAPFETGQMIDLAEEAVRRIDRWGTRGVTDISADHIAAMACVIAASGAIAQLRARLASPPVPETTKKEAPDAV